MWLNNIRYISNQLYTHASKGASQEQDLANINMIGDYAGGIQDFIVKPEGDKIFAIHRVIIGIRDTGKFASSKYGADLVLTNGLKLYAKSEGVKTYFTPLPVKTNADWAAVCYDATISNYGVGDEYLNVRWTFSKAGSPIWLRSNQAEEIGIELNDDFTDLVKHTALFEGQIYTENG